MRSMLQWLLGAAFLLSMAGPTALAAPTSTNTSELLDEKVCAELPRKSSDRTRKLANDVLEAVYALPEPQMRFFLKSRRDAMAFAIFPNVRKGGVVGAAIQGQGILAFRRGQKADWSPPILLNLEGQSIGPQAGSQTSNLIFIFKNLGGVKDFLSGHHHFRSNGVEVTIEHVGDRGLTKPMGITVHVFQQGMLLGQSFDRYAIHLDEEANTALYGLVLKPGCIAEGVRVGVQRPWFQRYYEKMAIPPDVAHITLEPTDLLSGSTEEASHPDQP